MVTTTELNDLESLLEDDSRPCRGLSSSGCTIPATHTAIARGHCFGWKNVFTLTWSVCIEHAQEASVHQMTQRKLFASPLFWKGQSLHWTGYMWKVSEGLI
jgi:hypothetical protein